MKIFENMQKELDILGGMNYTFLKCDEVRDKILELKTLLHKLEIDELERIEDEED